MDHAKYTKFDVSEITYKTVNQQDIKAYVLVPKKLATSQTAHPVLVKFHGGGLVSDPLTSSTNQVQ